MNSADNRPALAEGSEIGVYEIRQLLASDPLSLTYKAWNHHMNSPVLLREYFPVGVARRCADGMGLETVSDTDRKRYAQGLSAFLYDAEKLAEIEHEAIAKVLNALEFNNTGYQIMTFEHGQTISTWIASAYSFSMDQLQVMFDILLDGIGVIHERGLVHGMICPENILLRDNGDPILVNFPDGLLQFARDQGELTGTLRQGYAPAEQYRPDHRPVAADDLYALGATLYRFISGHVPVSAIDRLNLIKSSKGDPLALWDSLSAQETPPPWIKAVEWMLQPAQKDRPQGVSQVKAFIAELSLESEQNQQSSGLQKFKSGWARPLLTGKWMSFAAAIVLVIIAGLLSLRNSQVPKPVGGEYSDSYSAGNEASDNGGRTSAIPIPDPSGNQEGESKPAAPPVSERPTRSEPPGEKLGAASQGKSDKVPGSIEPAPGKFESNTGGIREPGSSELNSPESKLAGTSEPESVATKHSDALDAVPPAAGVPDQTASIIASHLEAAAKNLAAFNLTTPARENAFLHYQEVLKLDSDNQEARSGIDQILERYGWLVESALRRGEIQTAATYLGRAEGIAADSPRLDSSRSRLKEAQGKEFHKIERDQR